MIVLGLLVLLAAGGLAVSGITTRDDSARSPARSDPLDHHLPGPGSRLFFFGLVLAAAAMSGLVRVVAERFGGTNRTLLSRTPPGPHRDENRTGRDNTDRGHLKLRKQEIIMSTGIIVGIVVAVIVIGAVVFGVMAVLRRRRLQQRFGPEYDRVVGERDNRRKAEAELTERERRVEDLDIQPLTDSARASYAGQWTSIQERFVDAPADAVSGAQLLVAAVMTERGYPAEHDDQVLADLSVEHSGTLDRYRAAEEISQRAAAGTASTEDLRQAMVHYRALFGDLLGEPADTGSESAVTADISEQFTESDPKEMAT